LKLVMIGCGGMGTYQARKFCELGAQIVGAIDHNDSHRQTFCETYHVDEAYSSMEDMVHFIGKADAVSCCLPNNHHLECCQLAAQNKLAILCEKPLCASLQEADILYPLSNERPFMVNFSKRSTQAVAAVQTWLATQEPGALEQVEIAYLQSWQQSHIWGDPEQEFRWKWRLLPSYNPFGCLGDLGSHLLDLLYFLFDSVHFEKTLLAAYAQETLVEYQGRLLLDQNIPCTLTCSYRHPEWSDCLQLTIHTRKGILSLNTTEDRKMVRFVAKTGETTLIAGSPVRSTYERFMDWVETGETGKPDFQDGYRVQALLEEMME